MMQTIHRLSWLLGMLITILLLAQTFPAQAAEGGDDALPLCMPDSRNRASQGECLMMGPAAYIERMTALGFRFPMRPMASRVLSPELGYLPYQYAVVRDSYGNGQAPQYASLEDLQAGASPARYVPTNFSYVVYAQIFDGLYVRLMNGLWMKRGDLSPVAVPRTMVGSQFTGSPSHDIGWTFDYVQPRTTAGYAGEEIEGLVIPPNQLVPVYNIQNADNVDWYMIAPDQWVEGRFINRVDVKYSAPEGVDNKRWIDVNLAQQTLAIYDNNQLVFATVIASGLDPLFTQPGLFQIYEAYEAAPMSGATLADRSDAYYLENVPYTLYYDQARALHGAYWRTKLGHPQSHGCVNMSITDAAFVFNWARVGDWVFVYDPSGRTPTDPNYYGAGGA